MSVIKRLAGQTAIYGLSSIAVRFFNFLLTPLYTGDNPLTGDRIFSTEQFGIITEMYAYVSFLVVLLTYGMETAFFRFTTLKKEQNKPVYPTILLSLMTTTLLFIAGAIAFAQPIANWLEYPSHKEYVVWFSMIVGLDAISSIPLARLRADRKASWFAIVNLINVGVNISMNLFFLVYCPAIEVRGGNAITQLVFDQEIGVGYVFISNLVASICKFLLLIPYMQFNGGFEYALFRRLLRYSCPMLFVGLAGIVNETLDRILIKKIEMAKYMEYMTRQEAAEAAQIQNGIYGANYKLSMIITLFIQAFRYAAEPFFFSQQSSKNAKETYGLVMKYFVIVVAFMFLVITLNLHVFKYFIANPDYWEGLHVVPVLLLAYLFLGVYYNQSVWYKLTNKTKYGAIISLVGAVVTIGVNTVFIPIYGYTAAAWATLICYFTMMLLSYSIGRRYYIIPYDLKRIGMYFGLMVLLYSISWSFDPVSNYSWEVYGYHTILLGCFVVVVYLLERPKKVVTSQV